MQAAASLISCSGEPEGLWYVCSTDLSWWSYNLVLARYSAIHFSYWPPSTNSYSGRVFHALCPIGNGFFQPSISLIPLLFSNLCIVLNRTTQPRRLGCLRANSNSGATSHLKNCLWPWPSYSLFFSNLLWDPRLVRVIYCDWVLKDGNSGRKKPSYFRSGVIYIELGGMALKMAVWTEITHRGLWCLGNRRFMAALDAECARTTRPRVWTSQWHGTYENCFSHPYLFLLVSFLFFFSPSILLLPQVFPFLSSTLSTTIFISA